MPSFKQQNKSGEKDKFFKVICQVINARRTDILYGILWGNSGESWENTGVI